MKGKWIADLTAPPAFPRYVLRVGGWSGMVLAVHRGAGGDWSGELVEPANGYQVRAMPTIEDAQREAIRAARRWLDETTRALDAVEPEP